MSADTDCLLLSESAIFDKLTETVVIQLDRMSIALSIDEFIDFCTQIEEARNLFFKMEDYVIGTYNSPEGDKKITLLRKPDDEDFT